MTTQPKLSETIIVILLLVIYVVFVTSIPLNTPPSLIYYQQAMAQNRATTITTTPNFLTYKNSTYGISIQYPSDWTVNETNNYGENNSSIHVVWFYPASGASVSISIDFPYDPRVVSDLASYLSFTTSSLSSQGSADQIFNLIKSNTTAKLAGLPAYSLEYTSTNTEDNSTYNTLELGTIISGRVLLIDYIADSYSFHKFLPATLSMINSLRIDKSIIEQSTPPPPRLEA